MILAELGEALRNLDAARIDRVVAALRHARHRRARVYVMGNGGSAATASHLACDLAKSVGGRGADRLRAVALSDSSPLLTAWANDVDVTAMFSGQLETLLDSGDVVIAISVSGRSPNILAGLRTARRLGARTIGLLGADGGPALGLVDLALHVASDSYGVVETVHLGLVHALTEALREGVAVPGAAVARSRVMA